jgi:hypothetical protein
MSILFLLKWIAAFAVLITFIDKFVLQKEQKEKLKNTFLKWEMEYKRIDSNRLFVAHLKMFSDVLDDIFGRKLLSKKVFVFCGWFAFASIIVSLISFGKEAENPLSLRNAPGSAIAGVAFMSDGMLKDDNTLKQFGPEYRETVKNILGQLSKIDTASFRVGYTAFFMCIAWIAGSCCSILSLAIARKLLRELYIGEGFLTFLGALILQLLVFSIISSSLLLLILTLSIPFLGVGLVALICLFVFVSVKFAIWILFTGIMASWAFTGSTLKCVALIPLMPSIVCLIFIATSFCLYPFKSSLHKITGNILSFLIHHEQGPLAFLSASVCVVFYFIQQIAQ